MRGSKKQQGMALVAVILVSGFILMAVVAIASMASYGGRLGTRNERMAYQALLTAESGLNSFEKRVRLLSPNERYYGSLTQADLNTWLENKALNSLDMGSQGAATLTVAALNAATNTLTLQSNGKLSGLLGSKTVLTDLSASRALHSPRVSAALTSYVPIVFAGISAAGGLDGSTSSGIYDITTVGNSVNLPVSATPQPFNVTVADASLIQTGQYLSVGGYAYKVLGKANNTLELRPTTAVSSARTISSGSTLGLMLSATTRTVTNTTVHVSDSSPYLVGDTINLLHNKG